MAYQHQILGTVISSVLNYDQLCGEIGENPANDMNTLSYAPCDGRSIAGSQLDIKTNHGIINTPDLRGKFVRCLNVIYSVGQPGPFDQITYGDPDSRTLMSFQSDDFKLHNHNYKHFDGTPGTDYRGTGFGLGTTNTGDAGGSETRPKNISVYFYIKIN